MPWTSWATFPNKRFWRRWAAAIRPRWPRCSQAKPCSISDRAVASTCSCRRAGSGKVYGLDMTDEMLALARGTSTGRASGTWSFSRASHRADSISRRPRSTSSSPIASSTSPTTGGVAARGGPDVPPRAGRFAVSDIVVRGDVPAEVRRSVELWIKWIAAAWARMSDSRKADRRRLRKCHH